jgi:hypothetical protein
MFNLRNDPGTDLLSEKEKNTLKSTISKYKYFDTNDLIKQSCELPECKNANYGNISALSILNCYNSNFKLSKIVNDFLFNEDKTCIDMEYFVPVGLIL